MEQTCEITAETSCEETDAEIQTRTWIAMVTAVAIRGQSDACRQTRRTGTRVDSEISLLNTYRIMTGCARFGNNAEHVDDDGEFETQNP